jgi:putative membrane protein insertion efficiency factor
MRAALRLVDRAIGAALIGLVRVYQYAISPMLGQRCKYYPSCSNYAIDALRIHGPVKGTGLAVWRVLRCNPFSDGGVDFVPPKHGCEHDHGEVRAHG